MVGIFILNAFSVAARNCRAVSVRCAVTARGSASTCEPNDSSASEGRPLEWKELIPRSPVSRAWALLFMLSSCLQLGLMRLRWRSFWSGRLSVGDGP